MMSTKATTLNSEQNVIKVLLLSLHLLVAVHLTQHKLPATLCVAHAHLSLALVVLLLLARRVVPVIAANIGRADITAITGDR